MTGGPTIEAVEGDITRLEVEAIANAANTALAHGGGVAGAADAAAAFKAALAL